jgi:site-specific DNA-methyltransferase (adenine-specific)
MIVQGEGYTLYQGDCLEVLPGLGQVDAIICDLPYGTTACDWDSVIPLDKLWPEFKRIIKHNGAIVLFGSQPFTSELIMSNREWFKYEIVWEKSRPSGFLHAKNKPMKTHENIVVFSPGTTVHENQSDARMTYNPQMQKGKPYIKKMKHDSRVGVWAAGNRTPLELRTNINDGWRFPHTIVAFDNDNHNSLHETAKPVDLLAYLVRTYTNPGETVLDCTMGSGTTGVAALQTGRQFVGIEIDPGYFDISHRRIEDAARAAEGLPKLLSGRASDYDAMPLFAEVA